MLYLHGVGHFHPENIITNQFLVDLDIGTTEEWIIERVGIQTRHTVLSLDYIKTTKNRDPRGAREASLYTHAQTGAAAALLAIERAGIKKEDIGLVIAGSSVPDYVTPAQASVVAAELGVDAPCFDLHCACATFAMQINVLDRMRPEALPPFVLIVQPESVTHAMDFSDRRAAVLFGDGSAAAVVSSSVPSRRTVIASDCGSNPAKWDAVMVPRMDFFSQEGSLVQGFAIRKTTELLSMMQSSIQRNYGRFKFIGHQANMGMLQTVCDRIGINECDHWQNVVEYGNTACAGAPSVLSQHWDELQPGDHVAIAVVGGGLTWAHVLLRVEEA
ncbi:MAG: 3-oxoacyl-[acyl-carrier-protein] synthase III C-terminal domain-containing protein [Syntrophales bacterium]